ncbi:hypothetical protein MCEMIH22_01534 [Candidatus Methylacidiphilaceae bacterium]
MKGKVAKVKKGKGRAATGPVFIFPGPEGWEAWSTTEDGAQCVGPMDSPKKVEGGVGCVVCLPSRSFFSIPLWIPVEEGIAPRELAKIALESKNLLGTNPDAAVWAMEAIRAEPVPAVGEGEPGSRQLEAVAVLTGALEEEWLLEEAGRHEIAGRVLPAPAGGASGVLRKELGRWVVDFYSGGKWLHTQPLLARELQSSVSAEIASLLAQMDAEGTLGPLSLLVLRDEGELPLGSQDFLKQLPCPVRIESRAAPRLPTATWDLEPAVLAERRLAKAQMGERRKFIRMGIGLYAALMALAVVYVSVPLVRRHLIQRELAGIGVESAKIRDAAMSWREAGALVNPKMNALELLWQVSRPLIEKDPGEIDGVRLTTFDYNSKRLLLQGEGKDLEQTEKYFEWLKKEPMLAAFQWKHPQPTLLPNGNARFQAEGLPLGSLVSEEGGTDANPDAP